MYLLKDKESLIKKGSPIQYYNLEPIWTVQVGMSYLSPSENKRKTLLPNMNLGPDHLGQPINQFQPTFQKKKVYLYVGPNYLEPKIERAQTP